MKSIPTPSAQQLVLVSMIREIETYCHKNHINHRFVGGMSYGGLLKEETSYKIDVQKRTINLKNHNPLTLIRADGSVRDIDFILVSYQPDKMADLRRFLNKLKWQVRIKLSFAPPVSFEGLFPLHSTPPGVLRYVTTLRYQGSDKTYLAFDKVHKAISIASLEPWTLKLSSGLTYTTRNPIADYYAYQFRSPGGIKPKDITKLIHLKKLVDEVVAEGAKNNIDYYSPEYFGPWQEYIEELQHSTIPSVASKRFLAKLCWDTIGTPLAHGRGFFGKTVFTLFNFFTRRKV